MFLLSGRKLSESRCDHSWKSQEVLSTEVGLQRRDDHDLPSSLCQHARSCPVCRSLLLPDTAPRSISSSYPRKAREDCSGPLRSKTPTARLYEAPAGAHNLCGQPTNAENRDTRSPARHTACNRPGRPQAAAAAAAAAADGLPRSPGQQRGGAAAGRLLAGTRSSGRAAAQVGDAPLDTFGAQRASPACMHRCRHPASPGRPFPSSTHPFVLPLLLSTRAGSWWRQRAACRRQLTTRRRSMLS